MKKLSPKQKKIIDIVVTSLEVVVVLFAIILSAIVIANPNINSAEVSKGNIKLLPVLSDSMAGGQKDSFKKGDLIVAKSPKNVLELKEGQIITFKGTVNGFDALITHRIKEVKTDSDGNTQTYVTHGDNNPADMDENVNPNNVLAVYKYHLKGVGGAISWLQDSTHFLLVIVLPLGILFVWNIVMFVRMLMQWKLEKAGLVNANQEAAIQDEEEIKRKAIEEYLAAQNAVQNAENSVAFEEQTEEQTEEQPLIEEESSAEEKVEGISAEEESVAETEDTNNTDDNE